MATPSLPPAPTVTNESTQAALNTALGGFSFASATQDTSTPPPAQGVSIFKDADGNSLIVADAAEAATPNAAGKQIFNLAELQASLPPGAPVVLEGTGVDKVKGGDAGDNVINQSNDDTVFKTAGGDDAIVSTGFGSATYKTGEGNDKVTGGSGDELIKGNVGNDTLSGSEGSDTIVGGEGDDSIDGGAGSNDLTGGDGVDTFTFGTDANGLNTVEDFTKDDILKIADRNGDGAVTEGKDTGDFYQEAKGGDLIIHLLDKNGGEDARVILKDQTDTLKEGDTDGTFTL